MSNKSQLLLLLAGISLAGGPALAHGGGHQPHATPGTYVANGLVVSASTDQPGVSCPFSPGETYTGYLQVAGFHQATLRESVNFDPTVPPSVFEVQFVPTRGQGHQDADPLNSSGTFNYGTVGTTLSTGSYTATLTPEDDVSLVATVTLTYQVPVAGGTAANCTEQDQLTLIHIGPSF